MSYRRTLASTILAVVAIGALSACGASPGGGNPPQPTSATSTGTADYRAFSEQEAVSLGLPSSDGDDPSRLADATSTAKNICELLANGTLPVDIEQKLSEANTSGGDPAALVQLAQELVCPNAGK